MTATTDSHSAAELRRILEHQRSAFLESGPPTAAVRRDRVDRLILLITSNAEEFSDALHSDFGNRPRTTNLVNDVAGILPDMIATRRHLHKWMRPQRIAPLIRLMGLPTRIEKKPLGVVGIIGPWNFPIGLTVQPAASAFAAGNRVMIKFSEVTPATAELFAAKVADYFDPTELAVITGGADVGAAFSNLQFDHLFFTGSPGVGASVAAAAARNLVPVTLELGGKNPAVVAAGSDIAAMANRIMAARLANGGQICLCPDYVFVERAQVGAFADAALDTAATIASAAGGLTSIINDKNFDRIVGLLDDARRRGATVRDIGKPPDSQRRWIPPTVVLGMTDAMGIARDELFGPVLPVLPYDSIEEVCDYVAARPSPLAAYWYGPTGGEFDLFCVRTTSGGMTINDFAAHCAVMSAPFGGVGQSGWGAYHGKAGFDTFTHHRTVTHSRLPVSFAQVITPPYPRVMTKGVAAYIGWEARRAHRRIARHRSTVTDKEHRHT